MTGNRKYLPVLAMVLGMFVNIAGLFGQDQYSIGIGNYGGSLSSNINPALLAASKLRGDVSFIQGFNFVHNTNERLKVGMSPTGFDNFVETNEIKEDQNWKPRTPIPSNNMFAFNKYVQVGGFVRIFERGDLAITHKKELNSYMQKSTVTQKGFQAYLDSNIFQEQFKQTLFSYAHQIVATKHHFVSFGASYRLLTISDNRRTNDFDFGVVYQYSKYAQSNVYHIDGALKPFRSDYAYDLRIAFAVKNIPNNNDSWTYKPQSIDAIVDYGYNNFYLTAHSNFYLKTLNGFTPTDTFILGNTLFNYVSLIPRYEMRNFEIGLPVVAQFNHQQTFFTVGLNFGFLNGLYFGTDNLWVYQPEKQVQKQNLYLGIKIPIQYYKKSDKDEDGVSDKNDGCPDQVGLLMNNGCPDGDADGIIDKLDSCVDAPGIAKYNGCPDTDNDGVIDKEDDCPNVAGLIHFHGCPDTDLDSIPDNLDECPKIFGLRIYDGCPDTDHDSVPDPIDLCPTLAGKPALNGCPDSDDDDVPDYADSCVNEKGVIASNGCPDTDGDGFIDKIDLCVNVKGSVNGCPDADSDGVADYSDYCPDQPGPVFLHGCPDQDGDSLPDFADSCVTLKGSLLNRGCPLEDEDNKLVVDRLNRLLKDSVLLNEDFTVHGQDKAEIIIKFLYNHRDYKLEYRYFDQNYKVMSFVNAYQKYFTQMGLVEKRQFQTVYDEANRKPKSILLIPKVVYYPQLLEGR